MIKYYKKDILWLLGFLLFAYVLYNKTDWYTATMILLGMLITMVKVGELQYKLDKSKKKINVRRLI